ncbi:uncharacterized protein UV8b_07600 [Ustilaginoidea virens]|uniref:Uncharacterized protein n=1 Tax=Ustilaginoidea virens TaxID=1159556 RepID=A0A8E5HXC8_USTVR|nr:uncharacterized protein UV8b_07600 [Ustilaginoidea virens]QUC23359.1 hypothetical protein UV8b_07600 [Ustilaginoidea virens]
MHLFRIVIGLVALLAPLAAANGAGIIDPSALAQFRVFQAQLDPNHQYTKTSLVKDGRGDYLIRVDVYSYAEPERQSYRLFPASRYALQILNEQNSDQKNPNPRSRNRKHI